MAATLTTTTRALQEARRLQARVGFAAHTYITAYRVIGALLIAGVLDMLWPWPNFVRGLFMAALVGYVAWEALGERLRRRRRRKRETVEAERDAVWEAQVARAIEVQRPELDNALIHAVQFGAANPDDPLEAAMIRRELERAEREAALLPVEKVVAREAMERGRKALLIVAGIVLLSALLFPRVYRFELPRFFLFWGDHPPFTLTDFRITPGDARVRSGENLTLTVRLGGLIPDRLELVTGNDGEKPQAVPLAAGQNGEYTAQLDSLRRDTWYYVAGNTGRSQRYHIQVDNAPRLRRMTVTYRPPGYTKQGPNTTELPPNGELRGLSGTEVTLEVEADQPLAESELRLTREDMAPLRIPVAPKPDAPKRAVATFELERDGMFLLNLNGGGPARGLKTPEAAQGKVVLIHDEKPLVTFLAPGQNVIAKPDQVVPLVLEAVDDVALQRIEFHRIYNKGKDTADTLNLPNAPREFRHISRFDLKAMGAKPGDVVEYYATAYDNDPQGVHNSDSDRFWVWVVSEEDYKRVLAQQRGPQEMISQYRAQTEALRSLAEQQAQLAKEMEQNAEASRQARASGDKKARIQNNIGNSIQRVYPQLCESPSKWTNFPSTECYNVVEKKPMPDETPAFILECGPTQIISRNVRLRADLVLDEVRLNTDSAHYESRLLPGEAHVTIDELNAQITVSEPNLNQFIAANLAKDAIVRNVHVSLLTGKVRITGQFVKLISIPFTLEALPRIENGNRVVPEFLGMNASVFSLPATAVDIIEARLVPSLTLDLSQLPLPVYLNEVRCEPGRLIIVGKARIHLPAAASPLLPLPPADSDTETALPPAP